MRPDNERDSTMKSKPERVTPLIGNFQSCSISDIVNMKVIRKKTVCCLLILLIMSLSGCKSKTAVGDTGTGYVCLKIDADSSQAFITAILPQLDAMNKQTRELMCQYKWYRDSLHKCMKAIEAEKGLEPIPLSIKYPLPFKGEPNYVDEYIARDEPLFTPYESPDVSSLGEPNNIHLLKALLNLQMLSVNTLMVHSNEWNENFEKRLKRLEESLQKEAKH